MPLYAYKCTQCGHRFEKIQKFNSEQELVCPQCGGVLERPLTAPGLSFKGAGWYVNDYAGKSSAPAAESAPAAATTETKPAVAANESSRSESSSSSAAAPAAAPASSSAS